MDALAAAARATVVFRVRALRMAGALQARHLRAMRRDDTAELAAVGAEAAAACERMAAYAGDAWLLGVLRHGADTAFFRGATLRDVAVDVVELEARLAGVCDGTQAVRRWLRSAVVPQMVAARLQQADLLQMVQALAERRDQVGQTALRQLAQVVALLERVRPAPAGPQLPPLEGSGVELPQLPIEIDSHEVAIAKNASWTLGAGDFFTTTGRWRGTDVVVHMQGRPGAATADMVERAMAMKRVCSAFVQDLLGIVATPERLVYLSRLDKVPAVSAVRTLASLCKAETVPDWAMRSQIALDVAHGLAAMHEAGVAHTRLTAHAVHVTSSGRGVLLLHPILDQSVDEGVAIRRWLAPKDVFAADLWAYGVVLATLATMAVPFDGLSDSDVDAALGSGGSVQIPAGADVPAAFRRAAQRCLDGTESLAIVLADLSPMVATTKRNAANAAKQAQWDAREAEKEQKQSRRAWATQAAVAKQSEFARIQRGHDSQAQRTQVLLARQNRERRAAARRVRQGGVGVVGRVEGM